MNEITRPHAAIDIGTNSMHLIIAKVNDNGGFEILTTERESTRLGQDMGDDSTLTAAAIDRAMKCLDRFKQIADGYDAKISAIATSAVREAKNRNIFIDRALEELGVAVQIISGVEEGRLIHSGVLQALDVYENNILVFDIGGGSTEFVVGHQGNVLDVRSIKLGCIKLTDRFFKNGLVEPDSMNNSRKYIRSYLASVKQELSKYKFDKVVGCSGTVGAVIKLAAAQRGQDLQNYNGSEISYDEVISLKEQILCRTSEQRRTELSLDEKRVDIITGGIVLLKEILDLFGIHTVTFSSFALREGILYDHMIGSSSGTKNLRKRNAERLCDQLDNDPTHARHVAKHALKLFDETQSVHQLDESARELLEISSLLHNIGLSISHTAHHKHSYYFIKHSDSLTGFTQHEIDLVALVARYHRKSKPTNRHSEFSSLNFSDRNLVRCLAGILRISIGLDRRHLGKVDEVKVLIEPEKISIEPLSNDDEDLELEIYSARERSELLEEVLNRKIYIN